MKIKFIVAAIAGLVICQASVARVKVPKDENVGIEYLDASFKAYDTISKSIHSYAELGYLEYKSSALLISHLEENGFTVEKGVAGIPTAFVATFGSGSPVIGILAEYDALPELSQDTTTYKKPIVEGAPGHGCGHNLLGTASVAGAVAISKWLASGHEGTVKLFGCPAEEGGGGKTFMAKAGVFDGMDAIFNWHPSAKNSVGVNPGLANINIMFTFRGKTAHASGAPWKGRSALDGVEAFNYMVNLMREHVTPETRIHYAITNGGIAPNVVPDFAQVNYYIRHPQVDEMLSVFDRVKAAAEGAAKGTGTSVEWKVININYPIVANMKLCEITLKHLKSVGGLKLDEREKQFCRNLLANVSSADRGIDNFSDVVPTITPPHKGGGSSDVGCVSHFAPLGKLYVSTTVLGSPSHSWDHVAIAGTTIGTKAVINVGKVFYKTAVELYCNPDEVKEIRDEFEKNVGTGFQFPKLIMDLQPSLDYRK